MDANRKTAEKTLIHPLTKCLKYQLVFAALLRISLVLYGTWHDANFALKYTDVDYHVFSDAAKLVTEGKSPYARPTYRHSPILAWIFTLNVYVHPTCGKLLFAICDIIAGYVIYCLHNVYGNNSRWTHASTFVWLFNPLTLVVSTRGSAESLMTCLVLLTLYLLKTERYSLAGLTYGLSVHVRIYPLVHCLAFYFSLQTPHATKTTIRTRRIRFASATVLSLVSLTFLAYFCYGESFVNETYLYHLRHNFSPFYMFYLYPNSGADVQISNVMFTFLVQFYLIAFVCFLLLASWQFPEEKYLPFSMFDQTFYFVNFNKVCTSQYFLWYVGLIPFIIPRLTISHKRIWSSVAISLVLHGFWFLAYLVEFRDMFLRQWFSSLVFILGHMIIVVEVTENFRVQKSKQL